MANSITLCYVSNKLADMSICKARSTLDSQLAFSTVNMITSVAA